MTRFLSPALVGVLVALIGGGTSALVGRMDLERQKSDAHVRAVARLSLIQTRLSAVVRSTFGPTDALADLISIQGDISPELFSALAARLVGQTPAIRNISVAPGDQVQMVYPLAGNGKVLGVKFSSLPEQQASVARARQLGKPILVGPVKLVQGGEAFIQRAPVFVAAADGRTARYWGTVSSVAHIDRVMQDAGVTDDPELDIAIVSWDGAKRVAVSGDPTLGGRPAVSAELNVPGGGWQMRAAPKAGWPATSLWQSGYFLFGLVNSLLLAGLARLLVRRQREVMARNQALLAEMETRRHVEESLKEEESRFRTFFESSPDPTWIIQERRFVACNEAAVKILGYSRCGELVNTHPSRLSPHFQPDGEPSHAKAERIMQLAEAGELQRFEWVHRKADGTDFPAEVTLSRIMLQGEPVIYCVWRDISDRKRSEKDLRLASTVYENTADGIVITDPRGRIVSVNKAFTEITGYRPEEAIGRTPALLKSEHQEQAFYDRMWETLRSTGLWQGEIWNRRKNGELYPEWLSITAVRTTAGEVANYVGVFSDISALKRSQADLERLAHFDPLTGLPNRILFRDRLAHAFERARRYGHRVAVMLLDLDGFKTVNDSLGHPVGDKLLQLVAERIQTTVRVEDTVARLGGDEFALVLSNLGHGEDAIEVARKILLATQDPFDIGGHGALVTCSIGIAVFPDDGDDPITLIRNADAAMYKAKESGRNTYRFYQAEMTAAAQNRLANERGLRRGIENREFEVWYQPQVSLESGRYLGAEALVRWRDPERGLIPPGDFIPLAEQTGLIVPLGEQVLDRVCSDARRWLDAGIEVGRLGINVAGPQLYRSDFVAALRQAIDRYRLSPATLEIEVTETFMMENPAEVRRILDAVQAMGVTTAIDDFGTGYSSLSYLKQLPIDTLKIDRAFVSHLPHDPHDIAITRAILALGRSLQFKVIAEGIETPAQRDFLQAEGCAEGQGYLFAKPMPAEQFAAWLQSRATSPQPA
ncbi:MAG TPA: EAL domain-containing protein [Rhodocyclaceae bacterium]|nr:EAL domain-containing protein [Rhodocyclaceae bacterium]